VFTLLSSVDYCLAFHRLFKGCGRGVDFTVNYIIMLCLDTCDCTPYEMLLQVVNDARDFADLKEESALSRDLGWCRMVQTSGILIKTKN